MATAVRSAPRPEHRRIRSAAWYAVLGVALFALALPASLVVRALICQGIEQNLGRLMWLCPLFDVLLPLLAIVVPISLSVIVFQLHLLGAGAEQSVREHYEILRAETTAQGRAVPLNAAISAFRGFRQIVAESRARIGEGRRNLEATPRRHFRLTVLAFAIVAVAWGLLWWQWGLRGSLALSPAINQSATFNAPPLPETGPPSVPERPAR